MRATLEINCTATTLSNAAFAQTAALSPAVDVTGTCVSGYYVIDGAPYTSCNITGAWQEVQNPCIRTLAAAPAYRCCASPEVPCLHRG